MEDLDGTQLRKNKKQKENTTDSNPGIMNPSPSRSRFFPLTCHTPFVSFLVVVVVAAVSVSQSKLKPQQNTPI